MLAAIDGLTYEPNAGARALASQRTSVVGLVIPFHPSVDAVAQLPFIQTIAAVAREHDHEVLLVTSDEGSAGLGRLEGRSLCDAIVMMDIEAHDERVPVAASLLRAGRPDRRAGGSGRPVLRRPRLRRGGRLAVDELAATGHERLASGLPGGELGRDLNYIRRFEDAFADHASAHGLPYEIIEPVEPGRGGAPSGGRAGARRRVGDGRLGLVVPNAPRSCSTCCTRSARTASSPGVTSP